MLIYSNFFKVLKLGIWEKYFLEIWHSPRFSHKSVKLHYWPLQQHFEMLMNANERHLLSSTGQSEIVTQLQRNNTEKIFANIVTWAHDWLKWKAWLCKARPRVQFFIDDIWNEFDKLQILLLCRKRNVEKRLQVFCYHHACSIGHVSSKSWEFYDLMRAQSGWKICRWKIETAATAT